LPDTPSAPYAPDPPVPMTMLACQRSARLLVGLAALAQAADAAMSEVDALEATAAGHPAGAADAARWLPGIRAALERIRLECTDLRFAARALREALPPDALQPRLL
jgi:hypothetical protein